MHITISKFLLTRMIKNKILGRRTAEDAVPAERHLVLSPVTILVPRLWDSVAVPQQDLEEVSATWLCGFVWLVQHI